nr:monodehydroascorbate reductase [Tanacetum cinerariifolium]
KMAHVNAPSGQAPAMPPPHQLKPQEKKCKQAIETSDKPPKAKKSKYGVIGKKRSLKSLAASEAEDVPVMEPQVAAEDTDLQKALEESMKTAYALPRGPLPPVVIRKPESRKYQPLPEVPRKGKAKVTEEQVAHDLLSLQKPKKKSPADQYIFQRRVSEPAGSSEQDESLYAVLRQSDSEEESKKIMLGADEGGQGEGQAGPDPGAQAKGHLGLDADPGNAGADIHSIPSPVVHAGSDHEHMDLDVADVSPQLSTEQLNERFTETAYPMVQENLKLAVEEQVHQQFKATTTDTTTTTTTTLPPIQAQQQSTAEATMMKRIGELEHIMANLIQVNKDMEERLDKHVARLYTLEQLDIPRQVSKVVSKVVTDAVDWAMQVPLRNRFRDLPKGDMKEILHQRMTFTASSTIPSIYIQQFWDTVQYDKKDGSYRCQLDEQWFILTKDTLSEALQITPINNNQPFSAPPSSDALINFVNELGYPKLVRNVSNVVTNDMFQPWRALLTIINLCLTGKTSGFERPRAPVLQILWGIVKQANIDYAERIWEEFFKSIHTFIKDKHNFSRHTTRNKKATLIVIPSIRLTKLIIHHLQRRHEFHPRPDSSLHLPNEEPVLGYLKFSAKGTKREVFGMPIPGSLITADIQAASYYQEYLANVAKHRRYLAGETGSVQDSPAPKPTKPARKPKSTAPKAPPRPVAGPDPGAQAKGHLGLDTGDQDKGQAGSNPDEIFEGQAGPDPGNAGADIHSIPSHVVHAGSDHEHMDLDVADVSPQLSTEQLNKGFTATAYPRVQENLKLAVEEQVLLEDPASSSGNISSLLESPKVHQQFKATTTDTTTTTTTTLPPTQAQQQSTAEATMMKRIVSKAVSKVVTDAVDWAMQAPLRNRFRDLPKGDMKEILHQRMWEIDSYKTHEDHMQLFEALEKSMNRDHSEKLEQDLAEACKKKKKSRESPKMPHGSPPHHLPPPPPPTDDIATFIDWFCKRREECHKLLTDSVDDPILRNNVSKPLPLGGPPGQVTIQSDFFFNKDLDYLRYGSKGSIPALSISKMKAAYYFDVGLEQMVPDQFLINEECKYDIAAITVRTHMRILSVVRIKDFSMYGYDYMKKIVLRRADLNEHVIAERDFKHHVKDFQLRIKSYQTQLNLAKPQWDSKGLEYKHDYTVINSPKAVMFRDKYERHLRRRRIFRNLESFVGRRVREGDYILLKRTK